MTNEFSRQWFATFSDTMPEEWSVTEVAGVSRRLPLPTFRRVLDVCCGAGRHDALLSRSGYDVTGMDRDEVALSRARVAAPSATFLRLDQRDLCTLRGPFDAAVILWQSFGFFDSATNDRILADLANLLRPDGRLLLDLFHPDFFRAEQGRTAPAVRAEGVLITNVVEHGRLRSTIEYPDGEIERMDFELFAPGELVGRARSAGFEVVEQCCWWDERRPPDPSVRRYQSTFERR